MDKKNSKKGIGGVKAKLVTIIVLIMAIPLITAVTINYIASQNQAVENMEEMNAAQTKIVEHKFKSIVDQNRNVLQAVAGSVAVREVLQGQGDTDALIAWFNRVDNEIGDGNNMVLTGPDGMQVARAVGDLVDVSEREYFKSCKAEKKFCTSDQNISKTSGKRIATFISPVLDDSGEFIGAVQRNIDLGEFNELCKAEITEDKQDIFIGDNNGDLIAHTSMDLDSGEPVNFSSQEWYIQSRDNRAAVGSYSSSFNGGDWCISYQREETTGWVTIVASNKGVAMAHSNMILTIIIIVCVVMLVIAIILSFLLASSFTKPIIAVNNTVSKLSNGEFELITDKKLTSRGDEFGDIVKNINVLIERLTDVVENIKNASGTVTNRAKDLAQTSEVIHSTADNVSQAVGDMARGAQDQAETIQSATLNISTLSDAIQSVAENAETLAGTASDMNDASSSSADSLGALTDNINTMNNAMQEISRSIEDTSTAVSNIGEKVDGITNISSQTNLLALNASIEAARAGEAGRGFAVVAEEIGKLASDSAQMADEIRVMMKELEATSQNAINKSDEVQKISGNVSQVLRETVNTIQNMIGGVSSTVDGVDNISGLTQECAANKNIIVDSMSNLSAISEQNAAATEETSASMDRLNTTVSDLAQAAEDLDEVAETLNQELTFFKL